MKQITQEELNKKLELHKMWLRDQEGGVRADFYKADLSDTDLNDTDLRKADFSGADLSNANLCWADFSGADFSGADLSDADLSAVNARGTDFRNADLSAVNARGTDFRNADLSSADLSDADLSDVDLSGADLSGADLSGADLCGADLSGAKIDYQIEPGLLEKVARAALEEGALDMCSWHTCKTTHCIAGWACELAESGKELEEIYGTEIAGLLLLGPEAHSHFFDLNEDAKKYLQGVLAAEKF